MKYYIPDLETGFQMEVPKEVWETYKDIWNYLLPSIEGIEGEVIVYGTKGDFREDNFKDLFYG